METSAYKLFAENLLIEGDFQAKSTKSGKTVDYKSKEARDDAIKAGDAVELDKDKQDKDTEEPTKGKGLGKGDFERDSDEPEGGDQSAHSFGSGKVDAPKNIGGGVGKSLSDEQLDKLKDSYEDYPERAESVETAVNIINNPSNFVEMSVLRLATGEMTAEQLWKKAEDYPEERQQVVDTLEQFKKGIERMKPGIQVAYGDDYRDSMEDQWGDPDFIPDEETDKKLDDMYRKAGELIDDFQALDNPEESIKIINGKKYRAIKESVKPTILTSALTTFAPRTIGALLERMKVNWDKK